MPKKELNTRFIKGLNPPEKPTAYYDKVEKGLIMRHSKAGTKTFTYRYRFGGKTKRYKIGTYPGVSLADARKKVRKLRVQVDEGIDPQAKKQKRKRATDPKTFRELANEFKDKYLPTLKEKTRTEYKRIIDVELVPKLGRYPIKEISKNQIISLLDDKAYGKKPAPVMANRIRARLSKMYSFAVDRGLTETNPIGSIPKYKKTKKGKDVEQKRNRFYSPKEIQNLWEHFDNWNEPTGSVLKMLLITGQRKTETMRMKWDDIRGDVWTIPADMAKNARPHDVPLSEAALGIIEKMEPLTGDSDYVFCSPKADNAPMKWLTRARVTIQEHSKVPDFRPHDLRRTVATYMAKLGVNRTVLGKILNHKGLAGDDQVTAIYDRHGYMKEKRQAMNRWSHKLQQILEDEKANVTKIG